MIGWNRAVQNEIVHRRRYIIDRISCWRLSSSKVLRFSTVAGSLSSRRSCPLNSEAITMNGVACPERRADRIAPWPPVGRRLRTELDELGQVRVDGRSRQ